MEGVRKWGCSKCKGEEYEDQDHLTRSRNCNGDGPRRLYLDGLPETTICPWAEIDSESVVWFNAYHDWDLWRVLPFGGVDIMAEPAFVLEAFQHIRNVRIETENGNAKREAERIERDSKQWQKKQR